MITYHLQHNKTGILHPFPFYTRGAAELFRVTIGGEDTYSIYERVERLETEDERLAREDNEFENDRVERELDDQH